MQSYNRGLRLDSGTMKKRDAIEDTDEGPSRSQRKRDVEALQKLGEELLKLTKPQRQHIPLPDRLREAIEDAQTITSHGALKRQRQYIGKIMRDIDAEPIRAALTTLREGGHASAERFQSLERWRDRLLTEGEAALDQALEEFSHADRTQLQQLIRNAQKESASGTPPKSARALFRYLRDVGEP